MMSASVLKTPVLFIVFNRPQCTYPVFEQIRKARPQKLFICADGPRKDKHEEGKCMAVRHIVSKVDWECEVHTLFSDENYGCGKGPARGISWFFSHVDEGIILEDDCLPAPSFFKFCEHLLERYREDTRIMEIGGVNLVDNLCRDDEYSYSFSEHNHTWGWATWKRAWNLYDYNMSLYGDPEIQKHLKNIFNSDIEYEYFENIFYDTYYHIDSVSWWDYQWEFARRIYGGLSIVPTNNLIVNLGLGKDATHTLNAQGIGSNLRWHDLSFPLKHPEFVIPLKVRDHAYFQKVFTTFPSRIRLKIKSLLHDLHISERTHYPIHRTV